MADSTGGTGDILTVDSVRRWFGGVHAVDGCSLTVAEGSITGLIGPNGAGKSTLLELVSGFQRVDAGRIVFAGAEVQGMPAHKVSRLGLVRSFQSAREWRNLTVLENVLIAATAREDETVWRALLGRGRLRVADLAGRSAARAILAEFGLLDQRNERAGNLSGGQKRLLEFARIACARPRMVLLDEPQTGVNPVMGERMAAGIRSLNASGITVLMVEHNLGFVERLCERVWVMNLGAAIAVGSMAELRQDPRVVDAYLGSVRKHAG
jgi:ABC-type branched-subunit amino acid transport system ATPase component